MKKHSEQNLKKIHQPVIETSKINVKNDKSYFPIVGIGASAGGLEAIEIFLKNVPNKSNMAFVIVQHLDPTHKGMMVELIQRSTSMKVIQVKDRTKIQTDCVYVIPPNKDMSILHGVLYLLDMIGPRGLRLPIDFFFRSLAADQQDRSIGVILSGMGSDGTIGLKSIKEKAGIVLVQDPSNAKFDGMPRSAVDAGLADVVAKVEDLPSKIISLINHTPLISGLNLLEDGKIPSALEKILILLRAHTGQDFTEYKKTTVYRRIERRMSIHQIDKISNYVRLLQENPKELELLFNELLIGVTSFFRDPYVWENLKNKFITHLMDERKQTHLLRAWIPGCSTGEEAYSLAIIFREIIDKLKHSRKITLQIFATDLDQNAINKAREGFYPSNIITDVSKERLKKFFIQRNNGYEISNQIREMVIFAKQNIIMDPPFTKLDILICRNLLIYFSLELQKKLIPLFHYSLNPGGVLVLGTAETVGTFMDCFRPTEVKTKIYKRKDTSSLSEPVIFPSAFRSSQRIEKQKQLSLKPIANIQTLAEQIILQKFSPAAVIVNDKGDIIYISGRTGKYLEPAAGKANWNIFAMARPGLRYELTTAFQKSLKKNCAVNIKNISVGTNGGTQLIDLIIQPLKEPDIFNGMVIIIFNNVAPLLPNPKNLVKKNYSSAKISRIPLLEQELQDAKQEIDEIKEQMQTSQEELKSANEELQSTNEEIQSTNEELTTSKEEMQSMNEELQTINHELQCKVDELSNTNNDMKNLLDSTNIATLFLDGSLNVRRFTNRTSEITNLIAVDVGRKITSIASDLFYPDMEKEINEVLHNLVSKEKEIASNTGSWFLVRIQPYRTFDNIIDGVVITFSDITLLKNLEEKLIVAQGKLEKRFTDQTIVLDKANDDLRIEKLRPKKDYN